MLVSCQCDGNTAASAHETDVSKFVESLTAFTVSGEVLHLGESELVSAVAAGGQVLFDAAWKSGGVTVHEASFYQ